MLECHEFRRLHFDDDFSYTNTQHVTLTSSYTSTLTLSNKFCLSASIHQFISIVKRIVKPHFIFKKNRVVSGTY